MLQTIRDRTQGWFTWVLVIFICFTFALWGIHNFINTNDASDVVAEVDGVKITRQALMASYRQLHDQQAHAHVPSPMVDEVAEKQLQEKALQQLIISQVLIRSAHNEGFDIASKQLDAVLLTIPLFWENGQFSPERYRQIVSSQFGSEQDFLTNLKKQMMINQVQSGFTNTAFLLPQDEKALVAVIKQKRDIRYLLLSAKQFIHQVAVSPDEIAQYYEKHKEDFKLPEKARFEYIELSPVAEKTSPAADSANTSDQEYLAKTEKLENLSYANPNSLVDVAKALDLPIKESDYFTREGTKAGLGANPRVVEAAFSDEVLHEGYNSDVISLDDQTQIVLRLKDYKAADYEPLERVQGNIQDILALQKARQTTEQLGPKLLQQLQAAAGAGSSALPKELATKYQLSWQEKQNVLRNTPDINKQILQQAFRLAKPKGSTPVMAGINLPSGDYAIVQVTRVEESNTAAITPAEQKALHDEIALAYGQLDYELYVRGLVARAKIEKKNS